VKRAIGYRSRLLESRIGPAAPLSEARRLGRLLRSDLDARDAATPELDAFVGEFGWTVREDLLRAPTGGVQAMLLPRASGGFSIVVDPRPAPGRQQQVRPRVLRNLRIAHEIAHAFFYEKGSPPRRKFENDQNEERFCDEFAAALLHRPGLSRSDIRRLLATPRASLAAS
jgi:hypothetical protein